VTEGVGVIVGVTDALGVLEGLVLGLGEVLEDGDGLAEGRFAIL